VNLKYFQNLKQMRYRDDAAHPPRDAMFAADLPPPPPQETIVIIRENWSAPPPLPGALPAAGRAILVDARISDAVAAQLSELPVRSEAANQQAGLQPVVFGAVAPDVDRFAKGFSAAKVPSCGGNDALKFQPPKIGPIGVGGLLAVPFVALAAARGKCLMH
jgi:hypothetical protein